MKGVFPRELAIRDVEEAIEHDLGEAPAAIALGLIDELEKAYDLITRNPSSG